MNKKVNKASSSLSLCVIFSINMESWLSYSMYYSALFWAILMPNFSWFNWWEASLSWLPWPFHIDHFLVFSHKKMFQTNVYFLCSRSGSSHPPPDSCFFSKRNSIYTPRSEHEVCLVIFDDQFLWETNFENLLESREKVCTSRQNFALVFVKSLERLPINNTSD